MEKDTTILGSTKNYDKAVITAGPPLYFGKAEDITKGYRFIGVSDPYDNRTQYDKDILLMIDYLQLKVREKDWHGVSDAANDLREMEAKKQ